MSCNCNKPKCDGKCGISPSVLQINNPGDCTLFHRVEVPASMGDSITNPPKNGDYRNVLLYYVADGTSWLFSSDGVPQKLVSGFTDYEDAINLPSINGVTLLRNKTGEELGLQDKLTAGDGIEISSNNTISLSDIEQYAHFFNSVADMQAATNLVAGSFAKTAGYYTVGDGGSATYKIRNMTNDDVIDEKFIIKITGDPSNQLIAELVHGEEINVLTIGADDTNFSDCVNYLISKGLGVYIPKGEYVALSSINIDQDNTQLTCDGDITFEQDDTLFKVTSYRNMIKLNGNYIGNETDDCTFMKLGIDKTVIANNIFIHNVSKFGTGIELNTSTVKGIAYCKFDFDYLSVSKYGILFNQGAGANFINENYFEGGCIGTTKASTIGIEFIKGADQTDAYNGNVFEHICIEGHYDCGIKLEYAYYNHFENFRLNEGLVGSYYIDLSDCRYNYFSTKSPTKVSKIRDSETDGNAVNYFNILGCDNSFLRIANKFKSVKNKFVAQASDSVNGYANTQMSFAYNSTTRITEPAIFLNGGTVVTISHDDSSSTLEYVFPEIFGDNGMTSFYLKFGYFSAGDTPVLKDSTGGTIADRTQLGAGALSNHWYKIDFVGSIVGNRWVVTPLSH